MYYIFHKDNDFVGVSPFVRSTELCLEGVSVIIIDDKIPDLNAVVWNSETLTLDTLPQMAVTKLAFLSRFTMQERIAINMSNDPIVVDIMKLFDAAAYIDTSDLQTQQGVGYLAYIGILTSQRVMEVLSA